MKIIKVGKNPNDNECYKCPICGETYTDENFHISCETKRKTLFFGLVKTNKRYCLWRCSRCGTIWEESEEWLKEQLQKELSEECYGKR